MLAMIGVTRYEKKGWFLVRGAANYVADVRFIMKCHEVDLLRSELSLAEDLRKNLLQHYPSSLVESPLATFPFLGLTSRFVAQCCVSQTGGGQFIYEALQNAEDSLFYAEAADVG